MPRSSGGTELTVMISGGFRSTYEAVLPGFIEATGHGARMLPSPSMGNTSDAIPNRLARGEPCDVLIMVGSALDDLIEQGLVRPDTKADLALSPIGMAVRAGTPVPTIGTPDKLRGVLLAAKSVAYSDSASGSYVEGTLFRTLGIAEQMKGKAHKVAATPVGEVVAVGGRKSASRRSRSCCRSRELPSRASSQRRWNCSPFTRLRSRRAASRPKRRCSWSASSRDRNSTRL